MRSIFCQRSEIPPKPVVVVTGASAGVGRATAQAFAREGARLGLIARGRDRLDATKKEVEASGGEAVVLTVDVSNPDQIEAAARLVEDTFGPIDIWINNAMVSVLSPVKDMTAAEVRRVTEVTYLGYVYGTLAALHRMRARNRGVIVQVGSALAYRAIPLQSAYCAAKHAIQGFTESLRSELLHEGSRVCVTMVQLPAVNTPQFTWIKSRLPKHPQPIPPIYQPELTAQAIVWSAFHRRRELIVGFSSFKTIMGNRLIPGFLDQYLAKVGYAAQQVDLPIPLERPDNLWEPVGGDRGTRGPFTTRTRSFSVQLMATMNRGWFMLAIGLSCASLMWRYLRADSPTFRSR